MSENLRPRSEIGPWVIDVCEDCGRTRQDMSHGKCSTPTRFRRVTVVPAAETRVRLPCTCMTNHRGPCPIHGGPVLS